MKLLQNLLKVLKNPKTYVTFVGYFLAVTKFDIELYMTWEGLGEAIKLFFANPYLIALFIYTIYENFYSKGVGE